MLGTLRYMSPEQATADHAVVDRRTDVYSLGATLYELLTLRPAFEGSDRQELLRRIAQEEPRRPRRLKPAVPRDLETIILKAMAKDPAGRYATAQELADDLGRFLDDRPILARRPGPMERSARWARRHAAALVDRRPAPGRDGLGAGRRLRWCWPSNAEIRMRARRRPVEASGHEARRAVKEMYTECRRRLAGPAARACSPSSARSCSRPWRITGLSRWSATPTRPSAPRPARPRSASARSSGSWANTDEAERAYSQAIAVLEAIPAGALDGRHEPDGPSSADVVREDLSISYGNLGQLLIDTGRSEEAGRTLRCAAELTGAGGRHRRLRPRTDTSWRRLATGWASSCVRPAARARRRPPIARPSSGPGHWPGPVP